ncbi:hypothetical protein D5366_06100 [Neokomagataea tanensis]|uniref:Uncharacterized protein n=1 Tax=Neokomagataea tanensis TaxID=661191 RepID=A0A4Y6V848_9PROT|nr:MULTISPECIES: hypothetical protein [Neokomagataea]QDH24860.1 hypothetical protein D5366_06100 [Neokomagataea tanensis]
MLNSTVIHVEGVFLGTAIMTADREGFRFYATHESVQELHDTILPDVDLLAERARRLFGSRKAKTPQVLATAPTAA